MRKILLLVVVLIGLVSQIHGQIVLQKAKTGGHAFGVRLGMTSAELDELYTWLPSRNYGYQIAFIDYQGYICTVEVKSMIVSSISLDVYTKTKEEYHAVLKNIMTEDAISKGHHAGIQYTFFSQGKHLALLLSFKK